MKNNEGQTFLEFVFLMAMIMTIGYAMLSGFNGGVGTRWTNLVKAITSPSNTPVQLR